MALTRIKPDTFITQSAIDNLRNRNISLNEHVEMEAANFICTYYESFLKTNDIEGLLKALHQNYYSKKFYYEVIEPYLKKTLGPSFLRGAFAGDYEFGYPFFKDTLNIDLFKILNFKSEIPYQCLHSYYKDRIFLKGAPKDKKVILSKKALDADKLKVLDLYGLAGSPGGEIKFIEIEEGVKVLNTKIIPGPGEDSEFFIKLPSTLKFIYGSCFNSHNSPISLICEATNVNGEIIPSFEVDAAAEVNIKDNINTVYYTI